jgi:hypothetical protein
VNGIASPGLLATGHDDTTKRNNIKIYNTNNNNNKKVNIKLTKKIRKDEQPTYHQKGYICHVSNRARNNNNKKVE